MDGGSKTLAPFPTCTSMFAPTAEETESARLKARVRVENHDMINAQMKPDYKLGERL